MTGELRTKGGVLVATGWTRIVSNDHPRHKGSYVEMHWRQVTHNMHLVGRWKDTSNRFFNQTVKRRYYDEWRTDDGVKLYQQRLPVDYADYKVDMFYVNVKDLSDESREAVAQAGQLSLAYS